MTSDGASSRLLKRVKLPSRWGYLESDRAKVLERQLSVEVVRGHALYGVDVEAIAHSFENDDVIFAERAVSDQPSRKHWLVHLTWGSSRNPAWPDCEEIVFPADLWEEWEDG